MSSDGLRGLRVSTHQIQPYSGWLCARYKCKYCIADSRRVHGVSRKPGSKLRHPLLSVRLAGYLPSFRAWPPVPIFCERELTFGVAICYRPSVCLSVCLSVCRLSVTFVRPTQAVEIFGNISMAFGTLAIHWHSQKILRRSSQGNPSVGGVKHKRGSQI